MIGCVVLSCNPFTPFTINTLPVKILFEKRLVKIVNSISAFPFSESRNIFIPQENVRHLPSTIYPLPFCPSSASRVSVKHLRFFYLSSLYHSLITHHFSLFTLHFSPFSRCFTPITPLYFLIAPMYFLNARRNL
jgi:hypothetical protein